MSHAYLLQFIPWSWGCDLSLDAFNNLGIDWRTFFWLLSLKLFIIIMLFLIMIAPGIIVIPVSEELSQHLLDVVQGFLLGLGGLLLGLHPSAKVIIIVNGHVSRHSACLHRANRCWRGISTSCSLIIWPLEETFQWLWWHHPSRRGRLLVTIRYCYPGSCASECTFLSN